MYAYAIPVAILVRFVACATAANVTKPFRLKNSPFHTGIEPGLVSKSGHFHHISNGWRKECDCSTLHNSSLDLL